MQKTIVWHKQPYEPDGLATTLLNNEITKIISQGYRIMTVIPTQYHHDSIEDAIIVIEEGRKEKLEKLEKIENQTK